MGLYPWGNDHRAQEEDEQRLVKQRTVGNSHPGVKCWESWASWQEGGWIGVPISFPRQNLVWKALWKGACCCDVKIVKPKFCLALCVKYAVLLPSGRGKDNS